MSEVERNDELLTRVDKAVIAEAMSWEDGTELGKLKKRLLAHERRAAFLDTYAEVAVAQRLVRQGFGLRVEVPTPTGKRADFEVMMGSSTERGRIGDKGAEHKGGRVYVHVKRRETERAGRESLSVPSRLRILERIARPYVVEVSWREDAGEEELQKLVTRADEFLLHAQVGDELAVRDDAGRRIGDVRVIGPGAKGAPHVQVMIGLPAGFIDEAPRVRKLMERAYEQFMPRAENVIVIASMERGDAQDVERALLGSQVERWDEFPERGRRVAFGRSDDGFWWGKKRELSRVAAWMRLSQSEREFDGKMWIREGAEVNGDVKAVVEAVVGK